MTDKPEVEPAIPPQSAPQVVVANDNHQKRRRIILYVTLAFLISTLLIFIYWLIFLKNYQYTDDAYVGGDTVTLTSRQEGAIKAYFVDDSQYVEEGDLLLTLDPTDYELDFEKAKSDLAQTARQVKEMWEDVQQRKADVIAKQAAYSRSLIDYKNRLGLVDISAVSDEDFTHSRADLKIAEANLDLSRHQLASSIVALGDTPLENHPLLEKSKENLRIAFLRLKRCAIYAPSRGFIAQRNAQVGEWIKTTTPLMSIIPLERIWVDANFKETQLEYMRIGQPVQVTTDLYGSHVSYDGRVGGIIPGSGSVFSLLPPQNATGNWIKIVQRVPVRIYLNSQQIKDHPLLLGLSVYATVNIRNTDGLFLAERLPQQTIASTSIYDISMEHIDRLIEEVIQINLSPQKEAASNTDSSYSTLERSCQKG